MTTDTESGSTVTVGTWSVCDAAPDDGRRVLVRDSSGAAKRLIGSAGERSFALDRAQRQIDEESRTVELAFSSADPVEVWRGEFEILDHSPGAVRLARLNGGAALLMDHNSRDQVGVVESARVDADGKARAVVRFSRSARGEEVFRDVADGIRRLVSVGYRRHAVVLEREDDSGDYYRTTDWEPLEISIVSVPADASVGVGRSQFYPPPQQEGTTMPQHLDAPDDERDLDTLPDDERSEETTPEPPATEAPAENPAAEQIRALAREFRATPGATELAEDCVRLGYTREEFRAKLKDLHRSQRADPLPLARDPSAGPRIEVNYQRSRKLRGWRDDRQGEEQAYRAGMWALATVWGNKRAARWCQDHGIRAMTGSAVSSGGAVVPAEMSQAIIDLREEYGLARQVCRVVPMTSDTLEVPRRTGGVTAYFKGDNQGLTESEKSWDNVELRARKLTTLIKMASEYAEDAVIDAAMDLAEESAYAFAVKESECLFNGDGTSTYGGIVGLRAKLIDYDGAGTDSAGAVAAATATHDTLAEIDNTDITTLMSKLPRYARRNARWYCSQTADDLIFTRLKAAAGGNTMTVLEGAPQMAYLGYPIEIDQSLPDEPATDYSGLVILLFGDISKAVTMGDRRGFNVQVLNELYAENDQIGIKCTERFDINCHDVGTSSAAGPVVGLVGGAS